jgi:V/A-type H+-transporting ATPase subunit E
MAQEGEKRIINRIIQMADEKVSKITAEAQANAEEIRKDAELKANSEAQDTINTGTREARREKQRILADARLKAKRKLMSMQEQLMQAVFEQATRYIQQLVVKGEDGGYKYDTIITDFTREAAEIIGQQSLQLSFNQRDKDRFQPLLSNISQSISQSLGKKITLSIAEKTIPTLGGVNVKSEDGTVGVDNTIESRMIRFNEKLKTDVTRILF